MTERDPLDMQHQLQNRLWAGEYYHRGFPIVRLLADLAIAKTQGVLDSVANRINIDTDFKEVGDGKGSDD